jgi:hypothetical protein
VLFYHRFEDRSAELVTTPNDFRAQMKALKDNGISVISMQDLLAWRKGEKAIPSKSAVITIDDEWNSQHYAAWPIIKEFGYSFTLFIYTQFPLFRPAVAQQLAAGFEQSSCSSTATAITLTRRSEQIRADDGARLRAGLPALRIRTGRVATSSEGKDSGSGVRYSFRQQ